MPESATRPHLLYIAWAFPPARTAGVYRALATANAFAELGWDVTVLQASPDAIAPLRPLDTSLAGYRHEHVRTQYVPFTWSLRDPNVRTFTLARVLRGPAKYNAKRARRDEEMFPETNYGQWRVPLERAAIAVHNERPVNLTIATGNPHVDFAGALALHERHGVPYVLDYRDAWRLNVYTGETLESADSPAGVWESRFVAAAAEVWFVNEPIRAWHAEAYPQAAATMRVVENGWDPEFTTMPVGGSKAKAHALQFGYLGTMTPQLPIAELLEGWALAKQDGRLPHDAELNLAGYMGTSATPNPRMAAAIEAAEASGARFIGPVKKADVGKFYGEQDALVLAVSSGRYVTSGKVYEYLATGKPIVAVHDPGNDTTAVHAGYPLVAAAANLSAAAVADALARSVAMISRATDEDFAAARDFADARTRAGQLRPHIERLDGSFRT